MFIKSSVVAACLVGMAVSFSSAASAQFDPTKKVVKAPPPKVFTPAKPVGRPVVVQKHRSHTGRNVAAGVAAGVVGAIILNEAARASSSESEGLSCRQLERRCDDGQDWACRRYDRRGC